ncbi:hypothetical protein [Providencia manganoxydans]|uniref:hypothetical protein n=1 Tax=Providencia manganoxydans TaxID=2923283 RepID=UPI0032DB9CE5
MLAIKRNISDDIQYVVVGVVIAVAIIILAICFAGAEIVGLGIAALASLGSSLATLVLE